MTAIHLPFVGYYALIGTLILFSLLAFSLSWAVVGRVNSWNDYIYFTNGDKGTLAVFVLMALIMMANLGFAIGDLVVTLRHQHGSSSADARQGPLPITHRKSIGLLVLSSLILIFIIVCGAVAGDSGWINADVTGAAIAFSVLTFVVNSLWLAALVSGVFGTNGQTATHARSATKDVEKDIDQQHSAVPVSAAEPEHAPHTPAGSSNQPLNS